MGAEELETGNTAPVPGAETEVAAGQVQEPKMVPLEVVTKMEADMRELKGQVGNLTSANQILQGMIAQQQPADKKPKFDPDYVPTVGELDQILDEKLSRLEGRQKQESAKQRANDLTRMRMEAKKNYPDFDEVFALAEEVNAENPAFGEVIMAAHNPFETAYRAGMLHPKYLEKLKTKETQAAGANIVKNLNRQKTLAEVSGGGGDINPETDWTKLAQTNPQKIEERLKELINNR